MAKFIRYALATVCFAASVGCLALWRRSYQASDRFESTLPGMRSHEFAAWTYDGNLILTSEPTLTPNPVGLRWSINRIGWGQDLIDEDMAYQGCFGRLNDLGPYCPLWYPTLVFALAGVAALLGMVVAM
jgi:hypothetical protein